MNIYFAAYCAIPWTLQNGGYSLNERLRYSFYWRMWAATINTELTLACRRGYTSSGTSICQADRTWNPEPACYGN